VPAVFAWSAAHAQSATNEAWIGQTGETNTITIDQTGNGNSAGANDSTLRINQDGRNNAITIDQFGYSNSAGAVSLPQPGAPQGINQVGDQNAIEVHQDNLDPDGSNLIGAIFQGSLTGLSAIANLLFIQQDASNPGGQADHAIDYVRQVNTADGLGENVARIFQSGGLNGLGNTIERVVQRGYANLAEITQTQQGNRVGSARQIGHDNQYLVEQGQGETNTLNALDQIGDLNRARVTMSGDRNYVESVLQNNEGLALSGNVVTVMIAGEDNGGDGTGGAGMFQTDVANDVGVFAGAFTQIGEDNDISFTVNGGSENQFGIAQFGDGNGAVVSISHVDGSAARASLNEVAVLQTGDDNDLALDVVGDENATGAVVTGERNKLSLGQTGSGNTIQIDIDGDDNNYVTATIGFGASLSALAGSASLTPGRIAQSGNLNTASVSVTGDLNQFAFDQSGDGNMASLTVLGSTNQSVVVQSRNANAAYVKQTGSGNTMGIRQF
jgi:hypothetical protein